MRALILLLFPLSVLAGGLIPGLPNGGGIGIAIDPSAQSGAYAGNQGNSQNIIFRQGGGGRQVIETTPGLGAMYTPMTSLCWIAVSGQGVGMTVGVGATVPFKDVPCDIARIAKDNASMAVALANISPNDPVAQDYAKKSIIASMNLVQGSDPSAYLASKAVGITPAVMPMHRLSDWTQPGGIMVEHVQLTPGYVQPAAYVPPPPPNPAYNLPPPVDKKLDPMFEQEMQK